MRLLRLSTLLVGVALLVLVGILSIARQKAAPDLLYLWEWGAHQIDLYRLSPEGYAPVHILSIPDGQTFSPWYKIINGRLYFEAVDEGYNRPLYSTTLNGYNRVQVIPSAARFDTFSLDEEWIYYSMWLNAEIVLLRSRLDGSQRAVVARTVGTAHCQFAPHEDWLACESDSTDTTDIFVMRPDGSQFQNVIHDVLAQSRSGHTNKLISWSPDGQWILFQSNREGPLQLYRMFRDGSHVQRLSEGSNSIIVGWSSNGTWLYYLSDGTYSANLVRVEMSDNTAPQTVLQGYRVDVPLVVAENWLFLPIRNANGDADIYRMQEDGNDLQKLTDLPGSEFIIGRSPDGNWLYFSGVVERNAELMRLHLDSLRLERLTHTPEWNEHRGFWSPDGRWLIFGAFSKVSDEHRLMAMRLDGLQVHLLLSSQPRNDVSQSASWSAPPTLPWHARWLAFIGISMLAGAWVWRRLTLLGKRRKIPA